MANIDRLLKLLRLNGWELEDSEYRIVKNVSNAYNEEGLPSFFLQNLKPAMKSVSTIGWCKFKGKSLYTSIHGLPFEYPVYIMVQAREIVMERTWNNNLTVSLSKEELQRIMNKMKRKVSLQAKKDAMPKKKYNTERPMCEFLRKKYGLDDGMGQTDESNSI